MLLQLSDTGADITDDTDRKHVARIRELLLDVQNRLRDLLATVHRTAEEYLALQVDAIRLRQRARLPDLDSDVLAPFLQAPLGLFMGHADGVFVSISGVNSPLLLSFADAVCAFTPETDQVEGFEDEDIELLPREEPATPPFDEALIRRAEAFARQSITSAGAMTLEALLGQAKADYPDEPLFLRCLFLVLEQAIDPRTGKVAGAAVILPSRFDAGFVEGTDIRFASDAAGAHAS